MQNTLLPTPSVFHIGRKLYIPQPQPALKVNSTRRRHSFQQKRNYDDTLGACWSAYVYANTRPKFSLQTRRTRKLDYTLSTFAISIFKFGKYDVLIKTSAIFGGHRRRGVGLPCGNKHPRIHHLFSTFCMLILSTTTLDTWRSMRNDGCSVVLKRKILILVLHFHTLE